MEGIRSSLRKHPFLLRSSPLKGGYSLFLSFRWSGRREPWERGWSILTLILTLSLPECLMGLCKVTVTFESMDEIL